MLNLPLQWGVSSRGSTASRSVTVLSTVSRLYRFVQYTRRLAAERKCFVLPPWASCVSFALGCFALRWSGDAASVLSQTLNRPFVHDYSLRKCYHALEKRIRRKSGGSDIDGTGTEAIARSDRVARLASHDFLNIWVL
jgi:hypothetical protein